MTVDQKTIETCNAKAETYRTMVTSDKPDASLRRFINALSSGDVVLDLGCGPGNSAAAMAKAGLIAEAMDASAAMVEMARTEYGVDALHASFSDLSKTNYYDGICANFSLLHASRADMPNLLPKIYKALKPNGLFHIGMKTGNGDIRDNLGRMYSYYTVEQLNSLLTDAGFTVTATKEGSEKGLFGDISPFVLMTARA